MSYKNALHRIVIALGGNALGKNPKEQEEKVAIASKALVNLIAQGNEIIICHGNGPQVGMINLAFEEASKNNDKIVPFELPECTAMSQGYIGYHLQKGIKKELLKQGMPWHVATVITQIGVDKEDEAFKNPTKPIGSYYTEEEANKLMEANEGLVIKDDAGRGYRRMVPSPKPKTIIEKDSIVNMLDNEFIVIACGGGGVPVVEDENGDYVGVPAVIDKDFASAKLAEVVDADFLFILTAVDRVSINWGKPDQKDLEDISVEEAEKYCAEGHFAPGSMLPKVQAAIDFVKSGEGRRAVIASLEKAPLVIKGESGTIIHS
ncbi:carbamate kinase [Vallitalea sp.]|jgi:carbamate kinase|uniref:carbamate kinase n=1 Tax=Vallitalea sp. TaxID=1882829 RepID=UPI0025D734BB|nr:carbamate kinase [Vallitalea sp.]MCT4688530.1 carbamate kinase [Vallitalea sp.]